MTPPPPTTPGTPGHRPPDPQNPPDRPETPDQPDPSGRRRPPRPPAHRPVRRVAARSRDEPHRAASPLELLFDLCFVVAVAQGGTQLVHAVTRGQTGQGVLDYAMVFFAIWWAWVEFTWFASAYDNDDVLYRVATLVQIAGVLVLAAGVSRVFTHRDFLAVWLGYVIMRLALTAQWVRAARSASGGERRMALRYAVGVLLCQAGWLSLLFVRGAALPWVFLVMALAEMAVPVYAERDTTSSWHPHHISERYGLFTIIVLGETIAAATVAVKSGIAENDALGQLLPLAAGSLLIVFSVWWIYFVVPIHGHLRSNSQAFVWGYGHYLIFAAVAAIGAGIEIAVEQTVGRTGISALAAGAAVTVPTALYLIAVWTLHSRFFKVGIAQQLVLPGSALVVLVCTFAGHWTVLAAGCTTAVTVAVGTTLTARTAAHAAGATNGPEAGPGTSAEADAETGAETGAGSDAASGADGI